jgi:antitoxin MazE
MYLLYIYFWLRIWKNRVQKWGNSLAVRIPKTFARQLGWGENAPVRMSFDEDALVIKTDRERAWDLDAILAAVTDENIHPAWEAATDASSTAEAVDGVAGSTEDSGAGR